MVAIGGLAWSSHGNERKLNTRRPDTTHSDAVRQFTLAAEAEGDGPAPPINAQLVGAPASLALAVMQDPPTTSACLTQGPPTQATAHAGVASGGDWLTQQQYLAAQLRGLATLLLQRHPRVPLGG